MPLRCIKSRTLYKPFLKDNSSSQWLEAKSSAGPGFWSKGIFAQITQTLCAKPQPAQKTSNMYLSFIARETKTFYKSNRHLPDVLMVMRARERKEAGKEVKREGAAQRQINLPHNFVFCFWQHIKMY